MAGVNGKGGGSTKKEKGRREETPAISTGLFALYPPISWKSVMSTDSTFANQKLACAFTHGFVYAGIY